MKYIIEKHQVKFKYSKRIVRIVPRKYVTIRLEGFFTEIPAKGGEKSGENVLLVP